MKTPSFFLLLALTHGVLLCARAEDPSAPNGNERKGEGKESKTRPLGEEWRKRKEGAQKFENLSEEERARIRKAMTAAWANPAVKEARQNALEATRQYKKALREAVLAADPELGDLLNQIERYFGNPEGMPERSKLEHRFDVLRQFGVDFKAFEALDEATRNELKTALEGVMGREEVVQARKVFEAAEDKRQAFGEFRRVMHEALAQANPEALKKLEALMGGHPKPNEKAPAETDPN